MYGEIKFHAPGPPVRHHRRYYGFLNLRKIEYERVYYVLNLSG
jgi:hypothetical protein